MRVKTDVYYDRNPLSGGSNTTVADRDNEKRVEKILSRVWKCTFHKYAHYDNIDWWLERDNKMVAVAELKTAFRTSKYAYLNLRKYLNLKWSKYFLQLPAIIIFQFRDGNIYYDDIDNIEGKSVMLGSKMLKSYNDIEPGVSIPVDSLNKIKTEKTENDQKRSKGNLP